MYACLPQWRVCTKKLKLCREYSLSITQSQKPGAARVMRPFVIVIYKQNNRFEKKIFLQQSDYRVIVFLCFSEPIPNRNHPVAVRLSRYRVIFHEPTPNQSHHEAVATAL